MRYNFVVISLAALFFSSAAAAQDTPVQVVQGFYDMILHAQTNNHDKSYIGAMPLIKQHASKHLMSIIKKDEACQKREEGVCHLNFDVLVYGQDYTLSDVHVSALSATDTKATIQANFKNFDTSVQITFDFVKEGDEWKIDDLEGSSTDGDFKLTKILTQSIH